MANLTPNAEPATTSGLNDLVSWVDDIAELTQPHLFTGLTARARRKNAPLGEMVDKCKLSNLNPEGRPGPYMARSHTRAAAPAPK